MFYNRPRPCPKAEALRLPSGTENATVNYRPKPHSRPGALGLVVVGFLSCAARGPLKTELKTEKIAPEKIQVQSILPEVADGAVFPVQVDLPIGVATEQISALLNEKRFYCVPTRTFCKIYVPIKHGQKAGAYSVAVEEIKIPFQVVDGHYAVSRVSVKEKFVNPNPADEKRIVDEMAQLGAIYKGLDLKTIHWEGPFQYPVKDAQITSPYGNRRIFNGVEKNFHAGTDFRARTPTPIFAPQNAMVSLAKDLYYTGNTIILNHGYGIFTVYAHLSSLEVKEGQALHRGERMGLSGATGRVQAPHLHWGVIIGGEKVDPVSFVKATEIESPRRAP